jgi:hypothetical protein
MKKFTIYLSSTDYDLRDARRELVAFLISLGHNVIHFEDPEFPGTSEPDRHDRCVRSVDEADLLIALVDRRAGAPYLGKSFFHRDRKKISITWAEAKRAKQCKIPIAMCVRNQTWQYRDVYNQTPNADKKPPRSSWLPGERDNRQRVIGLLNFLQKYQNTWLYEFDSVVDLKDELGKYVDELAGASHYRIQKSYCSAFIKAREVADLLKHLYRRHSGEIWLLNNDLELIKSSIFEDVYVKKFMPNKRITAIRLLLDEERFNQFLDPNSTGHSQLVTNLSQLGSRLSDVYVGQLRDFPRLAKVLNPSLNIILYTSANDPDDPDSVALLRPHMPPFSASNDGTLSSDDLLIVCRQPHMADVFARMKHLLAMKLTFEKQDKFLPLQLRPDGKGFILGPTP